MLSPWLALQGPNFRLFVFSQFVWQNGRWLQSIAQTWLVLDLTGSPLVLGLVTAIQFAPIPLFSLFAGPLADRFDKRRYIMALQLGSVLQAVALTVLVASGQAQLWEIVVLAAANGTFFALDNPARQAFVSELVVREKLPSAVGLNSSISHSARIFGPAVGGLALVSLGSVWTFALTAGAFGVAIASYALIRVDQLHPASPTATGRLFAQVLDGLRYVRRERELLVPLILVGIIGTFGFNWSVYLPVLARYTFESDAGGFGTLNALMGVGSVAGGLLVAMRRPGDARAIAQLAVAFSAVLLVLALAPSFSAALAVLIFVGGSAVLYSASTNTLVQLHTAPEYRGRVLSLLFLLMAGGTPIGASITGAIAATWDIRAAIAINALLCLAASVAAIIYLGTRPSLAAASGRSPRAE